MVVLLVAFHWLSVLIGLWRLAETQGWQWGEWGSGVCGSQWKSGPNKIKEHQGK